MRPERSLAVAAIFFSYFGASTVTDATTCLPLTSDYCSADLYRYLLAERLQAKTREQHCDG